MGVGKFVNVMSKEADSNQKKAKRRMKKSICSSSDTVQKLYETCKAVFASSKTGVVPIKDDVERLQSVLDSMKPEDVGLSPEMQYFIAEKDENQPTITYLHLHECDKFSMGIFCLPPSAVIPLHNHPGMTVFSKLLFGTMHIKSYDWVNDVRCSKLYTDTSSNGKLSEELTTVQVGGEITAKNDNKVEFSFEVRLAKSKSDADFTAPCNTSILYPYEGGNIHCFTAKTACAVLDVLGPPYSDQDGRHCTYYVDHSFSDFSGNDGVSVAEEEERKSYAWLEDRGEPEEELSVVGALYRGPKITER